MLLSCSEPIEISFALENTIKPAITFEDINLLWTFTNANGETFTNANLFKSDVSNDDRNAIYNVVASTFIKAIQLNEHEKKVVVIKLTPRYTGQLVIKSVVGKISVSIVNVYSLRDVLELISSIIFAQATKEPSSLWGKLNFDTTIIKPDGPVNVEKPLQFDKKLELTVLPPAPALHISFTPIPHELLAGEIIPITVNLTNGGAEPLTDIYVAAEDSRWILGDISGQELPLSLLRGK